MAIDPLQLWLVVGGKDDRVAQSVTRALRMAGERAILVDSPEMIRENAAVTAICVVVFAPYGPSSDALATARELRFAAHIPVRSDDAPALPAGPWAGAPLDASTADADLVAQLRTRLLETVADDTAQARERDLAPPPALPLTKSARQQRRIRRLNIASSIVMIVALLASGANIWFAHSNSPSYTYHPLPTYPLGTAYSVHVPGTCDTTASVYWEGYGKNMITCRQDGVVMERDDLQYNDMTRFHVREVDPKQYFGTAYTVQATMQFLRSDKTSCMGLDTLEQSGSNLGSISFYVCGNGQWEVYFFDANGAPIQQLSAGALAHPRSTYTMRVVIQGASLALQLDGVPITTLTNTAYISTSSLGLVVSTDGNSTITTQALFSDFSVQPSTSPLQ